MTKPILSPFNTIAPLIIQQYEHYLPTAFDESMSLLQKVNKIIRKLDEIGEATNGLVTQWNEVMDWVMNEGLSEAVSLKLDEMVLDGTLGNLINEVLFADIMNQLSDPRRYGAKGDGVTDDTTAIQTLLNTSAKSINFRNGTFRITAGLTSSLAGRTIKSEGGTILADTQDITVLSVTGDKTKVSLDLEGNNKAAIGVLITGAQGCEVKNSKIENLYGQFIGACGIKADTFKGVTIQGNTIRNINALGNNQTGDNIGSSRAILVTSTSSAMYLNTIQNNVIEKVIGEEGDSIQILFYDGSTFPFLNAYAIISDNTIKDFNRRAIKIQGSNVKVIDNICISSLTDAEMPIAVSVINVISSENVLVQGNDITATTKYVGISMGGSELATCNRISVKNNRIKSGSTFAAVFYDYLLDSDISYNTIYDGLQSIGGQNSQQNVIQGNILFGGTDETSQTAINIVETNTKMIVRDNIAPSGKRLYMVSNSAPDSIIENNHCRTLAGCIRSFASASGSIYRNNTNLSATTTYIGDFTDQYVMGGKNLGSGASGLTSDIMFSSSTPVGINKHYNVGEIVFNTTPSAGGKAGWICVEAGTPGTWKAFGSIDA